MENPSNEEKVETNVSTETSETVEKTNEEKINSTEETAKPRRIVISQDIRYATEPDDQDKLLDKYNQYETSDVNACHLRFITDHRQKKNLIGRNDDEQTAFEELGKMFDVVFRAGYQNATKHSFKLDGTETNVEKCLIELLNRMFKLSTPNDKDKSTTPTKSPEPTAIFVTTINPDASITEEKKALTSSNDEEKAKFVPLERKPEYALTILITGQGQEVLKKNWSFFAGPLQQRLNVVVMNPFKLTKFGDAQWQNELTITGEQIESVVSAVLQLTAFINDVLGLVAQPFNIDESKNSNRRRHEYNNNYRQSPSPHQNQSSPYANYHDRTFFNRGRQGLYEQLILIRNDCVARIVGTRGSTLRRIQGKCHLRDMIVARHANENGYVECTLSAYQTRHLNFAIETIRSYLRNEDENAIQVMESNYIDVPSQSSPYAHSPHHDQPQLTAPNANQDHQQTFPTQRYQQQQQMSFTAIPSDQRQFHRETGSTIFSSSSTRSLQFNNGSNVPQPSYNFQNTPSFDFTHRPTSASRKTDKRPGDVNDGHGPNRTPSEFPSSSSCQISNGSSSSASSSVSPRHKSKRACPETKEIDCTTDEGFWIQKQYYHALDDSSKELFDSLMEKLENIRIVAEENAARKQQRFVGRNRANKTRPFPTPLVSTTHLNEEANQQFNDKETLIKIHQEENEKKIEAALSSDEQQENKPESTGGLALA